MKNLNIIKYSYGEVWDEMYTIWKVLKDYLIPLGFKCTYSASSIKNIPDEIGIIRFLKVEDAHKIQVIFKFRIDSITNKLVCKWNIIESQYTEDEFQCISESKNHERLIEELKLSLMVD